jgi:hypothetical protein
MAEVQNVNCAVDCVNGCLLGEDCPNQEFRQQAAQFIADTPLETMLEIADAAVRRRAMERMLGSEPPQWVFPEDGIQPEER